MSLWIRLCNHTYIHTYNEHVVAECHAAARDGGHEGTSGPSRRATEPGSAALPWVVLRSKLDNMSAWHASSLDPFLITICCSPSSPFLPSEGLRWPVLRCCVPFALLRVPCVKAAPPFPHGGAASPLQRTKRSWVPLQVLLCCQRRPRTWRLRLRMTTCSTLSNSLIG